MSDPKLNPEVKEYEVGSRSLRVIRIYPLSIADQVKMGDIIVQAIKQFAGKASEYGEVASVKDGLENAGIITDVMGLIQDNIGRILAVTSDVPLEEVEDLCSTMTNTQLTNIVMGIWEVNYEGNVKNVQNLIKRMTGKAS